MDTVSKKEFDELSNRLEQVLDIVLEHFKVADERLYDIEDEIEEIKNGIEETVAE